MNKRIEHASRQLISVKVRRADHSRPLCDILAERFKQSKKQAKRWLDSRRVLVNGQRVWMAHHALHTGDIIEVPVDLVGKKKERRKLTIIKECAPYVVINKPAGLLSNGENSAETILRQQLQDSDIRAVHRLDRDTSGCLIFARNTKAFDEIIPVFRERKVIKVYHAIVLGSYEQDQTTLHTMMEEEEALTHVRCLARNKEASYLAVRISTGRRHQIRKHLANLRHPVLGDRQYGPKRIVDPRMATIPRQMLHARDIEFTHPGSGEQIRAHSALPADFGQTLHAFGLK